MLLSEFAMKFKSQRHLICKVVHRSGWPGHLSSAMSIVEIVNTLFDHSKTNFFDNTHCKDTFVLSKGHGALAYYVYLYSKHYLSEQDLFSYNEYGSKLGYHPCRHKVPFTPVSTGSLGHGLPVGLGIAMSNAMDGRESVVYVLIGDGELAEGSNWEALSIANELKKVNICLIIDENANIPYGSNYTSNTHDKLSAFGCKTRICNGHDINELRMLSSVVDTDLMLL